jgi:RNA methyltransferase, TrmH family
MLVITSLQNPAIKTIRSLADKKHRRELGLFTAEGHEMLARARAEGWEPETIVARHQTEQWGKATILEVTPQVIAALSSQNNPPGILGVFRQRWAQQLSPRGVWLALEDMRDPGNLGTIIRTADAVAVAGVILVGDCCDPWAPECVRATTGSIFGMPLLRMTKPQFAAAAREWPGDVVGTVMTAPDGFRRTYAPPVLLVMGSESKGLSPEIATVCSTLVRIPMPGKTESLNVAAATALMLYEIVKP